MNPEDSLLLVVDDNETNRDLLSRRLRRQGYRVELAEDGRQALEMLSSQPFDLVLLDIMMPGMNGYEVLEHIKSDSAMRHIPVIMISAVDEIESVVKCIELGAEDYLPKPFNPVLLKARVGASLEKKHLRDQEQAYLKQLEIEREKSERLLLNILPKPIAEQLKQHERTIADNFVEATVLFADIVDFTQYAARTPPAELIGLLNEIFCAFDHLADKHRLEKIKTIGDAYMVVGGVPTPCQEHAHSIADMALDMQQAIRSFRSATGDAFALRIGIHSGPVIAGVIGSKKFIYDLWGDTVNTASRMESHGLPGTIQVSEAAYALLCDQYDFEERGRIEVKSKGEMQTYLLQGRKELVSSSEFRVSSHQ